MGRPAAGLAAAAAMGVAAAVAAKGLAVAAVPATAWSEYLWCWWDDVAVGLGFALVVTLAPPWLNRLLCASFVAYAAINALFVRALGSPIVASMVRGFDPAMGDSAALYLSATNGCAVLLVVASAFAGARLCRNVLVSRRQLACGLLLVAGPCFLLPAPSHPAHRNAWVALARSLLPRVPGKPQSTKLPAELPATGTMLAAASEAAPLRELAGAARGRSVVMVVLESAAARFVDAADRPMPFLAELAEAGLAFHNAYAVFPESIEGQVPIFCALPPMPDAEPADYARHAAFSLPRRLATLGYESGLFHAGHFRFLGMQQVIGPMGFHMLADSTTIAGERASSFGIDEEATVDALLRWVAALPARQRFLACYLPIAGHHPYSSPPGGPFPTDTQLGCYKNALHYADRSLRRLWLGLTKLRPAEDLLLCVVGDHGQAFGEHAGNFGHSFELYEENLRVPLVFHAPGSALAGKASDAVCSHLDVVPTLLDLLGVPQPTSLLARPLAGGSMHAFTDWGELLVAVREGRWKLIHEVQTGRDRLFDLEADPGERQCVLSQPDLTERLRAEALGFLAHTRSDAR
ncbi:MAG TPA: sulfatase-like hydrolase/transferase [Planctomycetota bacterium]|nr:sulfatase-like hydrolase/transferase [Planctomycetota bacterium]